MNEHYQKELAVCGFESVKAIAVHHPEKISRLFFVAKRSKQFGSICKYLAKEKRLYRLVESEAELEKLCNSVHHQGVVAMIYTPVLPVVTKEDITNWHINAERILLLDDVGNANNFGAIIRSAAFFGIRHIVISESSMQAQITTAAYRTAQGGMESVILYTVRSAEQFLRDCEGAIIRIGADHRAYRRLEDIPRILDTADAAVVVLGNEENGLSVKVKQCCDIPVRIAGTDVIESLNVAQAATLFCFALTQQISNR